MLSKSGNGETNDGTDTLARIARAPGVFLGMLISRHDAFR